MENDVMEVAGRVLERAQHNQPETSTPTLRLAQTPDRVRDWLAQAGVNTRKFGMKSLGTFDPKPDTEAKIAAEKFVRSFLAGDRPSLYLYSRRPGERLAAGCGKTHLAVAILRAILESDPESRKMVRFCYVPEMVDDYRRQFDEAAQPENLDQKYLWPELLIMDDFGAQRLTTYAVETINRVIYRREARSTIYTSNLSLAEVDAKDESGYIERATSRIAGEAVIVPMGGPDRRLIRK